MRPHFSRLRACLRVGADFFARAGALAPATQTPPRGVVDALSDLAHPGLAVDRIHPAVAPFFVDTAGLDFFARSRWRFPFSLLWPLLRPLMALVGQLVLPRREALLTTRVFALDPSVDGRPDVRAVVREYAGSGAVMQVVAYATHARGDTRYMHATFPLPGGHLAGVLRLDPTGEDPAGRLSVALTSAPRGHDDDVGIWYVTRFFALPLPLGETLSFWAVGDPHAPADLDPAVFAGATFVARHEQRLGGRPMVVHHYWFRPSGSDRPGHQSPPSP